MSGPATSAAPTGPAVLTPRPYRRYLTSALHTRFVHAVLLALFNSFIITFWTGKDYFWSWFPFGIAGIKAALFTMTSLFVFVLQLATMNIGRQTSSSPVKTMRAILLDSSTYHTMFWYAVSAWWFCEVYIWAVPKSYDMGWVISGTSSSSPDRLNERPIYMRFFFTIIALVQSGLHLSYGQSFLHIPISRPPTSQSIDQQTHPIPSVQTQLTKILPMMGMRSFMASGLTSIIAPFIYKAFFRELFWKLHLSFAKPFYNLPRSDAHPPQNYFIGTVLAWAFIVGAGLSFTWELAAYSFLVYLKQAPLKNGLPLSANSKDPNGTLLNGLTAKRSVVKTFAFWELALIAQKYPDRRKAIFADFERPNGAMWNSMLKAALLVISGIDTRIQALNPSAPQPEQKQVAPDIKSLPRMAKDSNRTSVFAQAPQPSTKTEWVGNLVAQTNKRIGQSTTPWSPPIEETKQRLLEYTKVPVGSSGSDLQRGLTNRLKTSPVADFVITNQAKKISSLVLGSPAGNASIIVDAVEAITKMLVASLNEDDFGKAVQTVPESVKQFTRTVMTIENLAGATLQNVGIEDERELEEVSVIVSRLKAALKELLAAFQVFLNDAGLGIKDLNEAKRASEERPLYSKQQSSKPNERKQEMEDANRQQHRQPDSRANKPVEDDPRIQRARETAQSLRRIGAQPSRQRVSNGERNVFGARDFGTSSSRHVRQVETIG